MSRRESSEIGHCVAMEWNTEHIEPFYLTVDSKKTLCAYYRARVSIEDALSRQTCLVLG